MQPCSALSDIWSAAATLYSYLRAIFGAPAAFLTHAGEMTRAERLEVFAYLRPLERILRCALVTLALTVHGPARPARKARAGARRAAKLRWPGENSTDWQGVRFAVMPPAPRRRARRAHTQPREVFSPLPLAKRMEAVSRVMHAPEPWIWRLARKLRGAGRDSVRTRVWRLAEWRPRRRRFEANVLEAADVVGRACWAAARADTS